MTEPLTTNSLRAIFRFPFQSPNWSSRFLVGTALLWAGMFIPILPTIFVYGYIVQVMRQAIKGEPLVPPDWKNWGELARDGLRAMAVGLAYLAPGTVILIGGWLLYVAALFGGMFLLPDSRQAAPIIPLALIFGSNAIWFISLFVGSLMYLVGFFPLPVALAHFVARDQLRAAFNVREWWAILRADRWGYFIGWVVTLGLVSVRSFAIMLVYFTVILCFAINFVTAPIGLYLLLVSAVLFGQFYREGKARLEAH